MTKNREEIITRFRNELKIAARDSPPCASLASPPAAAQTPRSYSDPRRPSAPRCCPRTAASTTSPGSTPPPAKARPSKALFFPPFFFCNAPTKAAREPIRTALGSRRLTKTCTCVENVLQKTGKNGKEKSKTHSRTRRRSERESTLPLRSLCPHNTTPPALGPRRCSRG